MLKQRVITALLLAPLVAWGILALPTPWFAALLGLVIVLGAWEWSRLASLIGFARWGYVALIGGLMGGLYPLLGDPAGLLAAGIVALAWWLSALASVVRYPEGREFWRTRSSARAVAGLFVLIPAWAALVSLQQAPGPGFVLLLVILIWGADIGAYFTGRVFGRTKLAPKVSPGKTWEGVGGGALLALGVALVGMSLLHPVGNGAGFLALCLATIGFSVLGDLSESMFKRMMEIKDSGGLLPGHGGILDRIDSLTAAAPIFALGLYGLENLA